MTEVGPLLRTDRQGVPHGLAGVGIPHARAVWRGHLVGQVQTGVLVEAAPMDAATAEIALSDAVCLPGPPPPTHTSNCFSKALIMASLGCFSPLPGLLPMQHPLVLPIPTPDPQLSLIPEFCRMFRTPQFGYGIKELSCPLAHHAAALALLYSRRTLGMPATRFQEEQEEEYEQPAAFGVMAAGGGGPHSV